MWHDVLKKGHNFAYITTYVGFVWDLQLKTVRLSQKKREK